MKALRALTFVLVLSVCAYAGDMDNGRVVAQLGDARARL